MTKKIISVVINNRANYARIKEVLRSVKNHPDLKLHIIAGASALLDLYGKVINQMEADGFAPDALIYNSVEGSGVTPMVKTTGLGIIELASIFERLRPDIVLTVADRYETLATAVAACYMNIPLAHTQGGEVTGSIDENVRHAITKLAHIHFPATKRAKDFLLKMGEQPERIFLTGCPAMDIISKLDLSITDEMTTFKKGVGNMIDLKKPYIVVLQHPVTTEYLDSRKQIAETLKAVRILISEIGIQVVWLWPNIDAGTDSITNYLRTFREENKDESKIQFIKNLSPENYVRLINNSKCLIGNSSSAIREGSFLGVPSVNIGNRQMNREFGENIMNVNHSYLEILNAIKAQIKHKRYSKSNLYGDGKASDKIANILAESNPSLIKKLTYLN